MAEKKKSLADQAYEIIKNNIMNLTIHQECLLPKHF